LLVECCCLLSDRVDEEAQAMLGKEALNETAWPHLLGDVERPTLMPLTYRSHQEVTGAQLYVDLDRKSVV
jgi:hypothetical protein